MKNEKNLALLLLIAPAVFFPGCGLVDWFKGKVGKQEVAKTGGADVLVSMNGQAVITAEKLNQEFDKLLVDNPQLKAVLPLMPDAKKNFLMGMVNQEVVDRWIKEHGVTDKEEYKNEFARMIEQVKRMLNSKYFGQEHQVQVSDADVKEFYEKNKDTMPDLMISRGGVKAIGVSFDKATAAQNFLAKVKEVKDISKAAQTAQLSKNLHDFKMVNAQSVGIDAALRDKIMEIKKVPSVELINLGDNKVWVVSATAKEESKYRPFEQIKTGLEQFVKREKLTQVFEQEIAKLKDEYKVVVNEEYFTKKPEAAQQEVAPQEGEKEPSTEVATLGEAQKAADAEVAVAQQDKPAQEAPAAQAEPKAA